MQRWPPLAYVPTIASRCGANINSAVLMLKLQDKYIGLFHRQIGDVFHSTVSAVP